MIITHVTGRLGADPSTATTSKGRTVKNFNVASDEYDGEKNTVQWVRVSVFNESLFKKVEALKKGSLVEVWGSLKLSTYTGNDGEQHTSLDLIADILDFVRVGKNSGATASQTESYENLSTGTLHKKEEPKKVIAESASKVQEEDDLPF